MIEPRAVKAGLLYCAVVFGAGFALGLVRSLWVVPLSGQIVAFFLQAPILLAIAWTACGWVTKRLEVSENFLERLMMGGVALAVLVVAEAAIGMIADGEALGVYFTSSGPSALLLGLLAQLAFAIFPILRRRHAG
jgi:hypothetical protein